MAGPEAKQDKELSVRNVINSWSDKGFDWINVLNKIISSKDQKELREKLPLNVDKKFKSLDGNIKKSIVDNCNKLLNTKNSKLTEQDKLFLNKLIKDIGPIPGSAAKTTESKTNTQAPAKTVEKKTPTQTQAPEKKNNSSKQQTINKTPTAPNINKYPASKAIWEAKNQINTNTKISTEVKNQLLQGMNNMADFQQTLNDGIDRSKVTDPTFNQQIFEEKSFRGDNGDGVFGPMTKKALDIYLSQQEKTTTTPKEIVDADTQRMNEVVKKIWEFTDGKLLNEYYKFEVGDDEKIGKIAEAYTTKNGELNKTSTATITNKPIVAETVKSAIDKATTEVTKQTNVSEKIDWPKSLKDAKAIFENAGYTTTIDGNFLRMKLATDKTTTIRWVAGNEMDAQRTLTTNIISSLTPLKVSDVSFDNSVHYKKANQESKDYIAVADSILVRIEPKA